MDIITEEVTDPTAIVGQKVAGESAKVRKQLEQLIKKVNTSAFDIADLLYSVKKNGYYEGYETFNAFIQTLEIKPRKAQYLTRMNEVMDALGFNREKYEPLGVAKLREICSLNINDEWVNPETKEVVPIKSFVIGFIEKGQGLTFEEIQQHVRTLKGLVGENNLVFLHFSVKQSVLENVVRPALDLAKKHIGSVSKDAEGISQDASDGSALEVIAIEYLTSAEEPGDEKVEEENATTDS
jgi:hypothetical protein